MLKKASHALCLVSIAMCSQTLSADPALDQVLAELQALREEVANLESRINSLETEHTTSAQNLKGALAQDQPRERKKWFDNMRIELKKAEVRASGSWTNSEAWHAIKNGMATEDVIAALGEPTARKFSVRRDTDEIFYYQGDLEGKGEPIEGEIRIYKGKVRRFSAPDFPTEI